MFQYGTLLVISVRSVQVRILTVINIRSIDYSVQVKQRLGKGAQGSVYLVENKTGKKYVLKKVNFSTHFQELENI